MGRNHHWRRMASQTDRRCKGQQNGGWLAAGEDENRAMLVQLRCPPRRRTGRYQVNFEEMKKVSDALLNHHAAGDRPQGRPEILSNVVDRQIGVEAIRRRVLLPVQSSRTRSSATAKGQGLPRSTRDRGSGDSSDPWHRGVGCVRHGPWNRQQAGPSSETGLSPQGHQRRRASSRAQLAGALPGAKGLSAGVSDPPASRDRRLSLSLPA